MLWNDAMVNKDVLVEPFPSGRGMMGFDGRIGSDAMAAAAELDTRFKGQRGMQYS